MHACAVVVIFVAFLDSVTHIFRVALLFLSKDYTKTTSEKCIFLFLFLFMCASLGLRVCVCVYSWCRADFMTLIANWV